VRQYKEIRRLLREDAAAAIPTFPATTPASRNFDRLQRHPGPSMQFRASLADRLSAPKSSSRPHARSQSPLANNGTTIPACAPQSLDRAQLQPAARRTRSSQPQQIRAVVEFQYVLRVVTSFMID